MNNHVGLGNFFPLLAIPLALLIPSIGSVLAPHTALLLAALLFFSFLGLDPKRLLEILRHPGETLTMSLTILVLTPLVVFPIMQRFFPEYFLGAVLFMLLPSAISAPAITAIYGGNVARSAVNTLASSLLSPISISLFLSIFLFARVTVSPWKILGQLALIIFLPFILGLIVDRTKPHLVAKIQPYYRKINLALLFLIFFAALSPYSVDMKVNLLNGRLWLAVLTAHAVLYLFARLVVLHEKNLADKIALQSNLFFLNVGLGVVIAQNYFGPTEMLFIVFCEIVWIALIGLFKYLRS